MRISILSMAKQWNFRVFICFLAAHFAFVMPSHILCVIESGAGPIQSNTSQPNPISINNAQIDAKTETDWGEQART